MSTTTNIHAKATEIKRPSYQRGLNEKRVQMIAETFNPDAVGALTVSKRPSGDLYIMDGGHRCAGAIGCGYNEKLLCIQYEGLSLAEEARLFLELNDSKNVSQIDKFKAAVIAEYPEQVAIDAIVNARGWQVGSGAQATYINAVSALEQVYRGAGVVPATEGPDLLGSTLEVLTAAWGHQTKAVQQNLLWGVAKLLGRFGEQVDVKSLAARLEKHTPNQVIARAKSMHDAQGGTISAATSKVIAGIYNGGKRTNKLPEWVWTR